MAVLIRELLELSRQRSVPESGQQARVDVAEVLGAVLEDQQEAARAKSIDLRMSTRDEGEIHVLADTEALQSALANLVGNAIQYTPDSGRVEVSLGLERGRAKVVVADSGIGIPEKDLENVFQEFFRSANAREASRIGTGIGLAIVKTTIENLGGRVAVESQVGQGSTFTIWLPRTQAAG